MPTATIDAIIHLALNLIYHVFKSHKCNRIIMMLNFEMYQQGKQLL